ncbi:hypothetical protein [Burkholderia pseudomallei]|uniref:hypothetical protein n=1 Tax=Burkholderia pseudomallei TaxID=28450 RepID=UPI0027E05195|nr:hypothetical protein [Burkholderia pseudomallei]
MKISRNLFKCLLTLGMAALSYASVAGTLVTFDNPMLLAMKADGKVFGYFGVENDQFSCLIFFVQGDAKTTDGAGYQKHDVATFTLDYSHAHFTYDKRDRTFDIPGAVYEHGDEWILQTSEEPPGCANIAGPFEGGPGTPDAQRFVVSAQTPALGIRVVTRKTHFFDKAWDAFKQRKGFLVDGDVVVVTEQSASYAHVRYVNPSAMASHPGEVTTGWVRAADLENPFPASLKQ